MTESSNWHTSSYTATENCIEVADNSVESIHVRDTKDRFGVVLSFPPASWVEFVESIKQM
ncbi:hypothetical protein AN219_38105 [Streptomyces nanshensis]|nr:hypothetical protein AN219_38105 [Streptomyces nanshensis]